MLVRHLLLSLKGVTVLSRKSGFVPRKDLTKGARADAERRAQCFETTSGDVLIQTSDNSTGKNGTAKHGRPRYMGGYSPARSG